MYGILHWLVGYIVIELRGSDALGTVNTLHGEGYIFSKLRPTENGYEFNCTVFNADAITARLDELCAHYEIISKKGMPFMVGNRIRRPGLMVGAALALFLVFASTRLVWDVRVECAEEYDEPAALSALAELGVYTGARLHSIDVYKAEQSFLINNPRYSKIVINLEGTIASVQLRLRDTVEHKEEKEGAYDIVAKEAGVVHSVTANKGEPAVQKGDTVAEGDVLISGTVIGVRGAYYLYRAEGSVTATVYREYTVIIPLKTNEKVYTGREETKTAYTVLGAELDLFSDEKSSFDYADVVTTGKKIDFLGLHLPVLKETVTYKEYILRPVTITESEAEQKARVAFAAYLEREVEGEIINTAVEAVYSEELQAVVLSATAEVITEIGAERPISPLS